MIARGVRAFVVQNTDARMRVLYSYYSIYVVCARLRTRRRTTSAPGTRPVECAPILLTAITRFYCKLNDFRRITAAIADVVLRTNVMSVRTRFSIRTSSARTRSIDRMRTHSFLNARTSHDTYMRVYMRSRFCRLMRCEEGEWICWGWFRYCSLERWLCALICTHMIRWLQTKLREWR